MSTSGERRAAPAWVLPLVVALLFGALLWLLRPLVVSGDGVGYIKRLITPRDDIVPGHLAYVPLLEGLRRLLLPEGGHGAAATLSTAFSSLSGGAACGLVFALARRLTGRALFGLFAAAGLAVCYGFYRASGDVEAYATCVALMTLAALLLVGRPDRKLGWGTTLAAGALLGLVTLFHTSLVLFTPFVFFALWQATASWRKATVGVVVGGVLSLSCFLAVGAGALGMGLGETVGWILSSDNGYAQPPEASLSFLVGNAGRIFYGVGRTLVHSPAPDRLGQTAASWLSAVGISYFVLAAVGVLVLLRLRVSPERRRALRPLWAWVIPLLVFGFLFWPSATERWVLVLPCMWLVAAVALHAWRARVPAAAAAALLITIPAVFNYFTVTEERRLDQRTLDRSHAVTAILEEGDLLLFPGHTWDEYVGFYEDAPVERFILASFAGEERGDREALLERLESRVEAAHRRGRRVVAVRIFDAQDSHHGWSLMRGMGISRDDVLILLARYETRRVLSEPVGVWEVLPAAVGTEGDEVATTR